MRILILGGSIFLGRHIVLSAIERQHEVVIFNRGNHYVDFEALSKNVNKITRVKGDRNLALDILDAQSFDAVIDTCGYLPQSVKQSTEYFSKRNCPYYAFISSISVYEQTWQKPVTEKFKAYVLEQENTSEINGETYGPLKHRCEEEVLKAFPHSALIIRPGLIVGKCDPTDRFTYWVRRLARGGNILAPGRPNRPVQFIDVRDLGDWIVHCLEEKVTGIYNATGPQNSLTMQEFLNTGIEVLKPKQSAKLVWLDDNALLKENLGAWIEMPLWIPEKEPNSSVFSNICSAKAQAKGLAYRPLSSTIEDIYDWDKDRNTSLKAGLDKEKEKHILACSVKI